MSKLGPSGGIFVCRNWGLLQVLYCVGTCPAVNPGIPSSVCDVLTNEAFRGLVVVWTVSPAMPGRRLGCHGPLGAHLAACMLAYRHADRVYNGVQWSLPWSTSDGAQPSVPPYAATSHWQVYASRCIAFCHRAQVRPCPTVEPTGVRQTATFFGDHLSRRSRPMPPYSRRVMCSTAHACMHAYRILIGACDPNFMADARLQAPTPLRPLCARPDGTFCRPEFCGIMQTAVMCGNFDIVWSRLSRGSQLQTTLHVPCDIRGVVPICIGWC